MNQIQAEKIDKILHLAVDSPKIYNDEIANYLGISKQEVKDLISIIEEIPFQGAKVCEIRHSSFDSIAIIRNYNTPKFLSLGGCLEYYKDELKRSEEAMRIRDLEVQNLKNNIESFHITKKQYQWNKWLAITAIIVSVASILLQVFKVIN